MLLTSVCVILIVQCNIQCIKEKLSTVLKPTKIFGKYNVQSVFRNYRCYGVPS